jgi:hypothetical protein
MPAYKVHSDEARRAMSVLRARVHVLSSIFSGTYTPEHMLGKVGRLTLELEQASRELREMTAEQP